MRGISRPLSAHRFLARRSYHRLRGPGALAAEFGLVMPRGFISAAEDTGLILWIGNWILQQACRQICAWNLQFPCSPPFTVAVNISAKQFAQKDLVSQVGGILRDSGLAP